MSYFINPVEEEQCVFLTYEGEMPPVEVVAVRYETTGLLAAKHWNRMVADFTELRSLTRDDRCRDCQCEWGFAPSAADLAECHTGLCRDSAPGSF